MALFDFWGTAIFSAITILGSAVSFSWPGLLLGIAMGIVAYVEYTGAQELKKFEPIALKRLALNQLFFGAALLAYAAWTLAWGLTHLNDYTGVVSSQMPPDLAGSSILTSVNDLTRLILILIYGTLIVIALTVQPLTALFYWSRRKFLDQYLSETPQWILDAQRAGITF